ncbi:DOT1-domain-containing protein [Tilletiaria anomala UBC 951]|uniref:Histone-lysine N-methyltransferase, H3 lysine-79 specific n=1 Tax=Tilletiaria anomala (strain ATCC 24038 / CBS 436.72 / UBC 951) TaxID=1037660 RepID=A0A066VH21_TILAU|nr:DOT1-domain-containing protein [Tilletiaria anomala UBC 951]KDN40776.1 DOT1-domain-containing protein [Tilletiaria anomala UBC 951]
MLNFFNSGPSANSTSGRGGSGAGSSSATLEGREDGIPTAAKGTNSGASANAATASKGLLAKGKSGAGTSKSSLSRPTGSSVVVTTVVKKKVIPAAHSATVAAAAAAGRSKLSSAAAASSASTNALSEAYRRRIAQDRERIAREKAIKERAGREAAHQQLHAKKRRKLDDDEDGSDSSSTSTSPGKRRVNGGSTPASASRHASRAHSPVGALFSSEASSSSSLSDADGQPQNASTHKLRRKYTSGSSLLQGYKKLGREGVAATYAVAREDLVEELPFREACKARGGQKRIISSKELVELSGRSKYGKFFRDLPAEPLATLEYPSVDASETFLLLCPKTTDEYDPIAELLRTVYAIAAGGFLTPQQREEMFGNLDDLQVSSTAGLQLTAAQLAAGPASSVRRSATPGSREGSMVPMPSAAGEEASPSATSTLEDTSSPRGAVGSTAMARHVSCNVQGGSGEQDSILRSFTKARNRRDGPLFMRTLARFNSALLSLKQSGAIVANLRSQMTRTGVPEAVWRVIHDQCYARAVGPQVEELGRYAAFSDNVYGELLPRFMSEIAQLTQLKPDSVFLDLGSGVGNLLIQTALQTGCKALGCEIMNKPSEFADRQLQEARTRWCMWALRGGEMDSWKGDFCDDVKVRKALSEADVVLVNNYAFLPQTNETLSLQFLDLKDGAHVVSLKPFVPPDFRLTERTVSSPLAILRVVERMHTSGCVSWADRSGKYYIQTVDRSLVRKFYEMRQSRSVCRSASS